MYSLVTGCAGFIGSHLARALIKSGEDVIGIDCFTDYYDRKIKENNIADLLKSERFTFLKEDLINTGILTGILSKTKWVFHLAAQPGVRASWGKNYEIYVKNNILVTQRLLEAAKDFPIKKFVFASSSSVYGDCELPMKESAKASPVSPYGISKFTCEHLCKLYAVNYGMHIVMLRYFTVFGPGQRPDMAFNRFIRAILNDQEITIYGNGKQTRDFTYVADIVRGTIQAAKSHGEGIFNIGGGSEIALIDAVKLLEAIIGRKARLKFMEKEKGDMKDTLADIKRAKKIFKYKPEYNLIKGLEEEVRWLSKIEKFK